MIRSRHMKRLTKEMTKEETIKSHEKEVFNILIASSIEGGIVKREKQKKPRQVFRSWAKRSYDEKDRRFSDVIRTRNENPNSNEKLTKNGVVAIAITIQMTDLIDRDHDPVVDPDHIREDIQDRIREIEIQKKEEDIDPKHLIQDRDPERENDRPVIVTMNRIAVEEVILEAEREVQCVGVVHLEEVHQEKCQDVAEVVAWNKIVGG